MSITVRANVGIVAALFALKSAVSTVGADEDVLMTNAIRSAVEKSLTLLERGAKGSIEQRKQCFISNLL